MFIWMGEILYRTKLSDDMFAGLAPWLQKLPGRLLHVNVIGCAIFAESDHVHPIHLCNMQKNLCRPSPQIGPLTPLCLR